MPKFREESACKQRVSGGWESVHGVREGTFAKIVSRGSSKISANWERIRDFIAGKGS